jgi:hypothetical protein
MECALGRGRWSWSNLKDNRAMIRRAVYLTSNLAHPDAVHDPITENNCVDQKWLINISVYILR